MQSITVVVMRPYVMLVSIVFLAVSFSASSASAFFNAAPQCASNSEREAINFRAMQSELMVAALSCDKRDAYNKFITMHQDNMPALGERLHGYFQRVNGHDSQKSMNTFVTDLANRSSKVSLNVNRQVYCNNAQTVFTMLLSGANPHNVSRYFSKLHNVSSCN